MSPASGAAPLLSIVVPSHRGAARLPRLLASLEAARLEGGFEIVVVDDGSDDGTAEVARGFASRLPLKVERHAANRGRAAARNTGIRAARGAVLLFLDDDMEAAPDVPALHAGAHRTTETRVVVGRIVLEGLDPGRPFHAFLLRQEAWQRRLLLEEGAPGFACAFTGQMSVRRETALRAGLFDEAVPAYGLEDIEFGYRLWRGGARFVYLDGAVTRHAAYALTLERWCERQAEVGRAAAHLAARHDTPEMRRYLRLEGGARPGSTFAALASAWSAVLRRPPAARLLAGPLEPAVRGAVALGERLHLRRTLAALYTLKRDARYFLALGGALQARRRAAGEPGARRKGAA